MWDPIVSVLTEPMRTPLIITVSGFFVGAILAGLELVSSSRGSMQDASPAAALDGGTAAVSTTDSPASLEDGRGTGSGGGKKNKDRSKDRSRRGSSGTTQRSDSSGSVSQKGTRSSGDNTRRSFYKLIFVALLCRLILLPVEAAYLATDSCPSNPGCILARTLPDLAFASAFSLLVLFYAQLAGTASGGNARGLSIILTQKGYFSLMNGIVYGCYCLMLALTWAVPILPYRIFQTIIWVTLSVIYLTLLALLAYFGPVLVSLLRPSLARRSGLAIRLITMCALCTLVFLSRAVSFALAVINADFTFTHGFLTMFVKLDDSACESFIRDAIGYAMLELGPAMAILFMMHQKQPGRPVINGNSSTTPPTVPVSGSNSVKVGRSNDTNIGPTINGNTIGGVLSNNIRRNTSGSESKGTPAASSLFARQSGAEEKGPLLPQHQQNMYGSAQ